MRHRGSIFCMFHVVALSAFPVQAAYETTGLDCISLNRSADCATGVAQFGLSVTQQSNGVIIKLSNSGTKSSSITDAYFDWEGSSALFRRGTIVNSSGVSFSWDSRPLNLPGSSFLADLSADSNSPVMRSGVNPGEWVSFNLVQDPATRPYAGSFRFGLHAQGFSGGGSESFTSLATIVPEIPEPQAWLMMLAGVLVLGGFRRSRFASGRIGQPNP